MRHDQDVFASLKLHDDGLQSDHHISVALSAKVSIVVLVRIPRLEVGRESFLNLRIGQTIADARVQLIERFPRQFLKGQEASSLRSPLECRGPDCQLTISRRLLDKLW